MKFLSKDASCDQGMPEFSEFSWIRSDFSIDRHRKMLPTPCLRSFRLRESERIIVCRSPSSPLRSRSRSTLHVDADRGLCKDACGWCLPAAGLGRMPDRSTPTSCRKIRGLRIEVPLAQPVRMAFSGWCLYDSFRGRSACSGVETSGWAGAQVMQWFANPQFVADVVGSGRELSSWHDYVARCLSSRSHLMAVANYSCIVGVYDVEQVLGIPDRRLTLVSATPTTADNVSVMIPPAPADTHFQEQRRQIYKTFRLRVESWATEQTTMWLTIIGKQIGEFKAWLIGLLTRSLTSSKISCFAFLRRIQESNLEKWRR